MEQKVIATVTPIKSENDNRDYRIVTLANKLDVMLVSDPTTDKAAVGMDVLVGHFQDPAELPGLAHFCEHMLFLGTEKYPDESAYGEFLNSHGGSSNAFTSTENTNYFFDISHEYLKDAMDRFAQFFIAPLFTEDATDRELNAVDSENAKNLQNDTWRKYQLLKSTSNPAHPFSKFATGNKNTLYEVPKKNGINVRDSLLKFHAQYYSANVMKLCVVGKEPLDTLQEWVVSMFSGIKNTERAKYAKMEEPCFSSKELGFQYSIVPVKDMRTVTIVFPIPSMDDKYDCKPNRYISHLIGHEGEGSILSYLRQKGWGMELVAGASRSAHDVELFKVTVQLTEKGLEHCADVVAVIFQYIELLKQSKAPKWIFDEMQKINELNFRFAQQSTPIRTVSNTGSLMQRFPPEKTFSASYLFERYAPDEISNVLEKLNPDNMVIHVISQTFDSDKDDEFLKERWYGTKHTKAPFAADDLKKWKNTGAIPKELHLPEPNEFIPTNFTIKNTNILPDGPVTYPVKLKDDRLSLVFFKQDNRFGLPYADIRVNFVLPLAFYSPKTTVLNALFAEVFKDSINEWAYNADMGGLEFVFKPSTLGIILRSYGYNEKLPLFTLRIVEKLIAFATCTEEEFNKHKERFTLRKEMFDRTLRNFNQDQPYNHAAYELDCHLYARKWTLAQKIEASDNSVDFAAFRDYAQSVVRDVRFEWLIIGNLNESEALDLATKVDSVCKFSRGLEEEQYRTASDRVVQLAEGNSYVVRRREYNPENNNSAIYQYYQIGLIDVATLAVANLLAQITRESAYEQLRTKEQLGYIVWSGTRKTADRVLCYRIIIQSSVKGADYLDSRIEEYLLLARKEIEDLDDKQFAMHKESLVSKLEEKEKKLNQESARWWAHIKDRQYEFDRAEKQVEFLKTVDKKAVLSFFDRYIKKSPTRAKLSVQIYGCEHDIPADDVVYLSLIHISEPTRPY
eukprot:TRINITY_DN3308_c0_g1_i2.p1 TRINITY_DN3308_c0_g1~~TRINITY_DN3308_c0_g1_i2.p1  ORF type:complete len:962 (-),score=160.08 TRINITY_DN3308_c0_g1_i2:14-2899(-)